MDNLDEVFGSGEAEPETVAEPATPEPVETEQRQDEAPAEAPADTAEPVRQETGPGYVPLAVVLDEREKRQELQRRLDAYEAQQAKQSTPDTAAPDPYDDPAGFAQHVSRQVEAARVESRFELSDGFARQRHGEDTVAAATGWANDRVKSDQVFAAEMMRQSDPIEWVVQQHKRDALLSDIGGNVDDWFVREAAKRGYAAPSAPVGAAVAPAVPKQAAPPVKVPRSLASQGSGPSDIRHTATGPLAGVDAVFP